MYVKKRIIITVPSPAMVSTIPVPSSVGILIWTCSSYGDYIFGHKFVICCARLCAQKSVKTAKYFVFPEGPRLTEKRNGACGAGQSGGTLSHEGSSFDLIIWNGQSAFVDEESLWYLGVKKSMSCTELWLIDCGSCADNTCHGQLCERIRQN